MSSNIVSNVTITGNLYVQATTVAIGYNLYVAVASGSTIAAYSTDGVFWVQSALPSSSNWRSVACDPTTGVFVSLGQSSAIAASSANGINWSPRTLPASASWQAVACNPTTGVFAAIARDLGIAASSIDGINWTPRTGPPAGAPGNFWSAMTVNTTTGLFVAVQSGANSAATSTDGITWTPRVILGISAYWSGVTCSPYTGLFVAVSGGGFSSTDAASSTDGITWTQRALPSANWNGVACNPITGLFVAVGVANHNAIQAASSTDGITWTPRTLPAIANWYAVTCNPNTGLFVAIANSSTIAAYSTDGVFWVQSTLPSSSNWFAVTSAYIQTPLARGYTGLGTFSPAYQLDLSTDGARKLTTTTWLTGSDSRIKTDIESANLQTCYDVVKSVDLKYFKWNFPAESNVAPDHVHRLGFIAQDVKEVFPNAVSASNSYGYSDFLNLNVDQINKALFGAVKYLMAKVEAWGPVPEQT